MRKTAKKSSGKRRKSENIETLGPDKEENILWKSRAAQTLAMARKKLVEDVHCDGVSQVAHAGQEHARGLVATDLALLL